MQEVKGELTAELALKLTLIMWEDMAEAAKTEDWELDYSWSSRSLYKRQWLIDRGFCDSDGACNVPGNCLLCQYVKDHVSVDHHCMQHCYDYCPITWGHGRTSTCFNGIVDYRFTPAEEFLEYMKTHIKED